MLPDRVSNPGPPTYESDALPIALRGPAAPLMKTTDESIVFQYVALVFRYYFLIKNVIFDIK